MIPFRMNPPPKKIEGTGHFLRRCEERLANSSNRTKKKFRALYDVMTSGRARTGGLDGKYAIQFGGEPRSRGDYLVVAIRGGHLDGFLSLLVDQYVIEPNTSTIPATRVLPLDQGGLLSNPDFGPRSIVAMTLSMVYDGASTPGTEYDPMPWQSAVAKLAEYMPSSRTNITVYGNRGHLTTRNFDEALAAAVANIVAGRVVNVRFEEEKRGVEADFEIAHLDWLDDELD